MNKYRGIDVSEHQGQINWQAVKNSGIEFVIIRAGYGQQYIDKFADRNVLGAYNAGLRIGLYWFSYPGRNPDTANEARNFVAFADKYKDKITLPLFYDLEDVDGWTPGSWENAQKYATNFCEEVKRSGYKVGVYYNLNYDNNYYGKYWTYHPDYFRWLAYPDSGEISRPRDCWQYSFIGSVPGISGAVDLDYWESEWPGPGPNPPEPPEPIKAQWYAKPTGAYAETSLEAQNNAIMIYRALYAVGWTRIAVAGLLGNFQWEGGMNPWRWQNDYISTPDSSLGYGLGGFTPAGKYIADPRAQSLPGYNPNFRGKAGKPEDGNAQVLFINYFSDVPPVQYIPTTAYPLTFQEYKRRTDAQTTPEHMAAAWLRNWERPANIPATEPQRQQSARYWYNFLETIDPDTPEPPKPETSFPPWLFKVVKNKKRRWYR